jgi:hypothetical protein
MPAAARKMKSAQEKILARCLSSLAPRVAQA